MSVQFTLADGAPISDAAASSSRVDAPSSNVGDPIPSDSSSAVATGALLSFANASQTHNSRKQQQHHSTHDNQSQPAQIQQTHVAPVATGAEASVKSRKKPGPKPKPKPAPSNASSTTGKQQPHSSNAHSHNTAQSSKSKKRPMVHHGGDAKRIKKEGGDHSSYSIEESDTFANATSSSNGPSNNILTPALLSLLGDFEWAPKFLQTVFSHLSQSRTTQPNWHVVAALWREALIEGGWAKVLKFVVKTSQAGKQYLLRSKRQIGDFTPAVCERLYNILATRDRGSEAAIELEKLLQDHRAYENTIRHLPFHASGKVAQLPCPVEEMQLEFTGGLPRGFRAIVSPALATPNDTAAASSSSYPTTDDMLDADVDDPIESSFMDSWPGLNVNPHQETIWSGAAIRRWARGYQVDVDKPTSTTNIPPTPGVPTSNKVQLLEALHSLHHRSRTVMSDRSEVAKLKPYLSTGLLLDLQAGTWQSPGAMQLKPHVHAQPPHWAPTDDTNLLDAILLWLQNQSPPTPDTFADAGTSGSSALLPRTLVHWSTIRRMCHGYIFPCAHYRRRWWLLCQEATEAPHDVQLAAMQPNPSDTNGEDTLAPLTLKIACQKVGLITQEITRRMSQYILQYGQPPAPRHLSSHSLVESEHLPTEETPAAAAVADASTTSSILPSSTTESTPSIELTSAAADSTHIPTSAAPSAEPSPSALSSSDAPVIAAVSMDECVVETTPSEKPTIAEVNTSTNTDTDSSLPVVSAPSQIIDTSVTDLVEHNTGMTQPHQS